jgi:hypothetical protein
MDDNSHAPQTHHSRSECEMLERLKLTDSKQNPSLDGTGMDVEVVEVQVSPMSVSEASADVFRPSTNTAPSAIIEKEARDLIADPKHLRDLFGGYKRLCNQMNYKTEMAKLTTLLAEIRCHFPKLEGYEDVSNLEINAPDDYPTHTEEIKFLFACLQNQSVGYRQTSAVGFIDDVGNMLQTLLIRTSTKQGYKYAPLCEGSTRQIRILKLLHASEERLQCSLEHVDLSSATYVALSYEWGNEKKHTWMEVIDSVNGRTLGMIPLTDNLYNALCDLHLSPQVTSKMFWIDQICIDQTNELERGHQVDLMGLIYQNAQRVISYLGPEHPTDEEAFGLIYRLEAQYNHILDSPMLNDETIEWRRVFDEPDQIPHELRCQINPSESIWHAIWMIAHGPWTRRLWMVQEVRS